jgi:hydroxypyruvate isomerase
MDPVQYYSTLKQIGYEAVEMVDPQRWPIAKQAGLQILNISGPGMQKGLNKPAHHPELLARIRADIQRAAANQIPHVIIFSGNRDKQTDADGLAYCIEAVKQLAPDAEHAGVTLVFEVLNTYDHPDYMAAYGAFAFDVVKAVSSPNVKVLYDIYHMVRMGEDVVSAVTNHVEYIAHLHVAGSPQRDFPGPKQEIDYQHVVRSIQAAGYRGYWGQEFLPVSDPLTEAEQAFQLFQEYLQ